MSSLDSRLLTLTDCFAQRFSRAGTFRYSLSLIPSSLPTDDDDTETPSVLVGEDADRPQKQHLVNVSRVDGQLSAQPGRLQIAKGDIVLWSADQSVDVGFRVRGRLGETVIDSAAMRDESIFTHAFGLAGETEWGDANGSGLHGVVQVAEAEPAIGDRHEAWLRTIEQGTLVHVEGNRATPQRVEIVVGQTVIWAVQKAPGVTISDINLIGGKTATTR